MGYVRHASRLLHKVSRSVSRFHWVGGPRAGSMLLSCTTDKLLAITCMHTCTDRLILVVIVTVLITIIVITIMVFKTIASS